MKELRVPSADAKQTLIRFLGRIFPTAGSGFLYRMLRKKNIVLNEKKATGRELLREGDVIRVYFSDETFDKFYQGRTVDDCDKPDFELRVLYEDDDIIAFDKPCGVLSQKDSSGEPSMNEYILSYLAGSGVYASSMTFKPSVANRLDRNTGGIILAGKTYEGQSRLSRDLKSKIIKKYYVCLARGRLDKKLILQDYLIKDERTNTARVVKKPLPGAKYIETHVYPIGFCESVSLLRVELLTGKSHQIRAHLKSIGHPLVGDPKYMDSADYSYFRDKYKIKYQLLHAAEIVLPEGIRIVSPVPKSFITIARKEGISGDLELPGA